MPKTLLICMVVLVFNSFNLNGQILELKENDKDVASADGCGPSTIKAGNDTYPHVTIQKGELASFVDNISDYKGKVVTLPLSMNSPASLREGGLYPFKGSGISKTGGFTSFDIKINVDPDLKCANYKTLKELPDAKNIDELTVTFLCSEGALNSGNRAVMIKRR